MSGQEDSSDKSHEPTPRKLEDARRKGEIARAPDLVAAVAYLGLFGAAATIGGPALEAFGDALLPMIDGPDRLEAVMTRSGPGPMLGTMVMSSLTPLAPFFLVPAVAVLLALFALRSMLFTPSKLMFKASRLSPIENAKNKFGRRGLFEFLKSFVKLSVYSLCLALFIRTRLDQIIGSLEAEPKAVAALMAGLMLELFGLVVLVALLIGGLDFLWQRADHIRRNRMSQKELRDEFRESEGDPMLKQHRRGKAQEYALGQMMRDVPDADVVIVNPTHYAVALKWSRKTGAAPVCVAKGQDAVALRIREIAQKAGVPIHSDPPTARALHATTDIGEEIAPEHYRPVAAAIRFAEDMRRRARGGR